MKGKGHDLSLRSAASTASTAALLLGECLLVACALASVESCSEPGAMTNVPGIWVTSWSLGAHAGPMPRRYDLAR